MSKEKLHIRCAYSIEYKKDFREHKASGGYNRKGYIVGESGNCYKVLWDGNRQYARIHQDFISVVAQEVILIDDSLNDELKKSEIF